MKNEPYPDICIYVCDSPMKPSIYTPLPCFITRGLKKKIILARDSKQCGGGQKDTRLVVVMSGNDEDDDTQMRAQRSKHMRASSPHSRL